MKNNNTLNIITNVIGFNLKNTTTTIVNPDGTIKLLNGKIFLFFYDKRVQKHV